MRDFSKNTSSGTFNRGTASIGGAKSPVNTNSGEVKIRPKYDVCTKVLKDDGSIDSNAKLVKLCGMFENTAKESGKTYYSGTAKEQGAKFYLYANEGNFDLCMRPLLENGKVDAKQKMTKIATLEAHTSKAGSVYHSGISKEQGIQITLYPVVARDSASNQ